MRRPRCLVNDFPLAVPGGDRAELLELGPGSDPRSHPATSGDAAHTQPSSSRTRRAGHATGSRSLCETRSRRSPCDGRSSGAPAADTPTAARPACARLIGQRMTAEQTHKTRPNRTYAWLVSSGQFPTDARLTILEIDC